MSTEKKPGRKKGDSGPRQKPALHPVTEYALSVKGKNLSPPERFAEAAFGATIHPVLAELVWWARFHRDTDKGASGHESELAAVSAIALAHGDAEFFRQLAYCLDRLPDGTARNYPFKVIVLCAHRLATPEDRPPTAGEVAAIAYQMAPKTSFTVSRLTKEIDRLGLPRLGSKN